MALVPLSESVGRGRSATSDVVRLTGLSTQAAAYYQNEDYWAPLAVQARQMEAETMAGWRAARREALQLVIERLGNAIPAAHRVILRETWASPNPLPAVSLAKVLRLPVEEVQAVIRQGITYDPAVVQAEVGEIRAEEKAREKAITRARMSASAKVRAAREREARGQMALSLAA